MRRRFLALSAVLAVAGSFTLLSAEGRKGEWTGYVTDTMCGATGNSEKHAHCALACVEQGDAKFALYDATEGALYVLNPQETMKAHAGQRIMVKGILSGNTITATSVERVSTDTNSN